MKIKGLILKLINLLALNFVFMNTLLSAGMGYSPQPIGGNSPITYERLGLVIDQRSSELSNVEVRGIYCVEYYYYCKRREMKLMADFLGDEGTYRAEFTCNIEFDVNSGMVDIYYCRNSDRVLRFRAMIPFEELDIRPSYRY